MIHATLVGTLGRDAEIRDAGTTKVVNFSVAVNQGYGEKKTTLWVECAKFGDKVNIAEYLKKGTQVVVVGEPSLREYATKDGANKAQFTLRVSDIKLVGGKGAVEATAAVNNNVTDAAPSFGTEAPNLESLPF